MDDTTITQTGIMSIPREIRDEIYAHLLTSTYRVDTSPSYKLSNLSEDTQVGSSTGPGFGQEVTPSPLIKYEQPSSRVAILRVNKAIGAEAREVLYKFSTFVFNADGASPLAFDNIKASKYMHNVDVNIDLTRQPRDDQRRDYAQAALAAAQKLLSVFACRPSVLGTCTISIRYYLDWIFMEGDFPDLLCRPTSFKTVYLKIEYLKSLDVITPATQVLIADLEGCRKLVELQAYVDLD